MAASTLPVRYDMSGVTNSIYRGDSYHRLFRPWYRDELGVARILDTTGWTGRMQVRPSRDEDAPLIAEYTSAAGRIVTGQQDDPEMPYAVGVFLTAEDTAALPARALLHYDIELTAPDGLRKTFYYGEMHIEGDVTR